MQRRIFLQLIQNLSMRSDKVFKIIFRSILKIFLLSWIHQVHASPTPAQETQVQGTPQILILTGLHGYIEPCGCTIDLTLGSLERLAYQVKALKKRGPTAVLVAGGHLFEHEELPQHRHAQDGAKARLLRETLAELGVDALMPHVIDLALGASFYRSLSESFPERDPTVNLEGGLPLLLHLGTLKLGVIGLGVEGQLHPSGKPFLAPLPAARAAVALLKAQGAQIVIALSTQPRATLRELAQAIPELELWTLAEGALENTSLSPIMSGQYLIEAGDRGRNLAQVQFLNVEQEGPLSDPVGDRQRRIKELQLRLKMKTKLGGFGQFGGHGQQIDQMKMELAQLESQAPTGHGKHLIYQLIPINASLPIDPEIEIKVKAYQASLKELNLSNATGPVPLAEGANGYAKRQECELCHPAAVSFWKDTAHGRAWETIEKADKTYDVECVSCHVTGFQAPGGSALGHTTGFEDVQCEACHGPSAQHADVGGGESGTRLKVSEEVCKGCHNALHSPKFSYQDYLPKILGPGHGAPLPVDP